MAERCPPPPPFADLPPLVGGDTLLTEVGQRLVRIYSAGGRHPAHWHTFRGYGPVGGMRFDHHPPPRRRHPSRSVLYAATSQSPGRGDDPLPTVIAERFGDSRVIDRTTGAPYLVVWRPNRALTLLNLSGSDWVVRAGANSALMAGSRAVAQRWSRAIWSAYPSMDGLLWASSPRPAGSSVMLYERARDSVPSAPELNMPLSHPALEQTLATIARQLGFSLL